MSSAFREWAETYDETPNPLLELADRSLQTALGDVSGLRVLDAGCGTGRWMRQAGGARVVGFDFEPEMLRRAPRGAVVLAELGSAPFAEGIFDLVVASLSLSYAAEPAAALADLCTLVDSAGRLAVADLAGEAVEAGWKRPFGIPSGVAELEAALARNPDGWDGVSSRTFAFGEAERKAIGEKRWATVAGIPAVRVTVWRRAAEKGRSMRSARGLG